MTKDGVMEGNGEMICSREPWFLWDHETTCLLASSFVAFAKEQTIRPCADWGSLGRLAADGLFEQGGHQNQPTFELLRPDLGQPTYL